MMQQDVKRKLCDEMNNEIDDDDDLQCQPIKNDRANLEDYIYELEKRTELIIVNNNNINNSNNNSDNHNLNMMCESNDLLNQLAQKENDLILAAELGKALLERNEELSRANERITEDYSHKLEVSLT